MSLRIEVDPVACEANGLCVEFLPEFIELGDDDVLRLREGIIPEELEGQARDAAMSCPRQALRIVELQTAEP